MSKPDDIPQDVWDAAREAYAGFGRAGHYDETLSVYEHIARAILAERERCAGIAHGFEIPDPKTERFFVEKHGASSIDAGVDLAAECIAAAIRKGEQP